MSLFCVNVPRSSLGVKKTLGLVGAIFLALLQVAPSAEAARKKHATRGGYNPPYASIVYDVNNGRILQQTNASASRHPASITKVMTLYMLFEQLERGKFKLDTQLPVSSFAARQKPSKLSLKAGETIEVEDAIKALVTKSANDVAVVIAEAIGGSEVRFAEMMTQKARAIGMQQTTFRNASGLPNVTQVTTARDLVTLGQAIQDRFPKYYAYFGTRNFAYDGAEYRNHNRLLGQVEGVDGIKTGYTNASGFNLLTSARGDGRHIITVVLGGRSARSRDSIVATLVRQNLPIAHAGLRTSPRVIETAKAQMDDDDKTASTAPVARGSQNTAASAKRVQQPDTRNGTNQGSPTVQGDRPRTAVIAEGLKAIAVENSPPKNRQTVNAVTPKTASNTTTALALAAQTPRQPVLRWVETPAPQHPFSSSKLANSGNRPIPPGNVQYTNSTTQNAPVTPETDQALPEKQPLTEKVEAPQLPLMSLPKNEQRLSSGSTNTPAPTASFDANAVKTTPQNKAEAAKPATPAVSTRSGWVIQLAAAESETKARSILDSAIAKNSALLKEADPFTEAVTKGDATFYRARFAGFDAEEAQTACKSLKRSGFSCFAQKL